ncbi:MAG: TonB-dependent receptor, partial [Gammaproteobacteria bacterium]
LEAAKKAQALDPDLARTQTVLGFAYLTRIEVDKAKTAFDRAIARDPADPLPRLGLGLAKIREGDLDAGTEEIEIAASLDPNNSLVRSYLGKAYYEQKRSGLARTEFEQAKLLDPKDPTPWFYDAIQKQTTNRPVEALHDLQKAIDLNDNRAVYRSKLLLDEDLAARSANLARIYDDLGFQQRARVEAWKSVSADPASFSAHRFLADSYSSLQRHEIARVSELLQSQLLQPLSVTPLQPELAVANLAILQGAGPSSLSFYEYNPLFARNGIGLQTNVLVGNNDTVADNFVVSGIHGRFSGSVGQFHYETDGFRMNNDLENDVYNAFGQVTVTPDLSLQAELRRREQEAGVVDITLNKLDPSFRQESKQDSARIGARYEPTAHHNLLGSFIYTDSEFITDQKFGDNGDSVDDIALHLVNPVEGYTAEIQHLFRGERFKTISGIGYGRLRNRTLAIERALPGGEEEPRSPDDSVDHREDIHGYTYI